MTRRRFVVAIVAWAALGVGLTFESLWPTPWIRPQLALSVEAAGGVLLLALAAGRRGGVPAPLLRGLAIAFVALAAGRYVEVAARELYGRPINFYYDVPHVPRVLAMLGDAFPLWQVAAAAAALATGIAAVYAFAHWAWGRIGLAGAAGGPRCALVAVAAGVCVAYPLFPGAFAPPVSASYARQVALLARALGGGDALLGPSPAFGSDLARVAGADVFVVFVESYGAAAYDRPAHAARLAPAREALAQALADGGWHAASARVAAPTFGGASWLAHASLLAGVEVRDGDAYNLLLTQRRETLVRAFARGGYRTVALMPGLRQDWREGHAFYAFDAVYGAGALDYRGPPFGWWRIPDQFALARLERLERGAGARAPLFVFFPTISSHAPFRPLPPYQPDWARLGSDVPYGPEVGTALRAERGEWRDLDPAYADSIGYALTWLGGYLRERSPADAVFVVLGDHQPPGGVAGERPSWEVPVHVIARRTDVIDALVRSGFGAGLELPARALGRTHELTPLLLDAFGSEPEAGVDVARAVGGPKRGEAGADRVGL